MRPARRILPSLARVLSESTSTTRVGNILRSRVMGAQVRLEPAGIGIGIGFKDSMIAGFAGQDRPRRVNLGGRPAINAYSALVTS